ncbi:hypothetical protein [Streptomyces sp. NPDC057838]|uniref:hypothetical protein n=1 Tax=unclassified Streptomyces TaxID=2593676 RepID=UPI00369D66E6
MKPRTLPALAALSVTTALLLTACGGIGKSSDNENVAGAEQSAESPKDSARPSASEAEDRPDGVDLTLPEDMDLIFDWRNPKDANEAAALDDAANSMRAIYRGVHKRTVNDAAVTTYFTGNGLHYAKTQISIRIDAGWTATGTRRHYRAATRSARAAHRLKSRSAWTRASSTAKRPRQGRFARRGPASRTSTTSKW